MKRATKQIIYGIGYACFFFLIISWIWSTITKVPPSCTDGKRNQDEVEVDCGGSLCISCELKNITPIEFLGYSVMSLKSGKSSLLVHIKNGNENHHAKNFSYNIHLIDEDGYERQTFSGKSSLVAGGETYLFATDLKYSNPQDVKIEFENISWTQKDSYDMPNLVLQDYSVVNDVSTTLRVKGTIKNSSLLTSKNVGVIAVVAGSYGDIFASRTTITEIAPLSSAQFVVIFPDDPQITSSLKTNLTRIIVQGE